MRIGLDRRNQFLQVKEPPKKLFRGGGVHTFEIFLRRAYFRGATVFFFQILGAQGGAQAVLRQIFAKSEVLRIFLSTYLVLRNRKNVDFLSTCSVFGIFSQKPVHRLRNQTFVLPAHDLTDLLRFLHPFRQAAIWNSLPHAKISVHLMS